MTDREIAILFMSQLLPAMQARTELSGVSLARSYQQTQQGATIGPYVYFFKIGDRRYGHPARRDEWDLDAEVFTHEENQVYESTYQFSAWVPQDPSLTASLTESDVLNVVSSIMQSDGLLLAFRAAGVGVLRVTDVRNPYIVDDRDLFEAVPSFDVVLTHARRLSSETPAVLTYEANIERT